MLAIIESLRYWRGYLAGATFIVRTDHKPLEYFFSQPNLSGRQLRWAAFLADFLPGVSIVHNRGKDHLVPDALSRLPTHLDSLALSLPHPDWLSDLSIAQERDSSLGAFFGHGRHRRADFTLE